MHADETRIVAAETMPSSPNCGQTGATDELFLKLAPPNNPCQSVRIRFYPCSIGNRPNPGRFWFSRRGAECAEFFPEVDLDRHRS